MGLTVACARCHDHKFDPIPTKDYYALAGIYMGTNLSDAPLGPPDEVKAYAAAQAAVKKADDRAKKLLAEVKAKKDPWLAQVSKLLSYKDATEELARLRKAMPPAPPVAHVVSGNGPGMKVYLRGNPATKGEDAPKGFLQVLPSPAPAGSGFTRLDLANAIGSKDNPLTARVFVNRAWAWHFGRGLVNTPSNFGALGDKPSHPELLDWLAVNFVKNGWSVKWLHRQIMTAAVYQLASTADAAGDKADAANVYLWRGTRKRLEVEDWRDTLLAVSGQPGHRARRADVRPARPGRAAPHPVRESQPARAGRPAAAVRLPGRERHRRQPDRHDGAAAATVRAQQRVHGVAGASVREAGRGAGEYRRRPRRRRVPAWRSAGRPNPPSWNWRCGS
jgi:hypothetical protein